jgi:tetratricopeptide (TPR) repeat protein
MKCDRCGIESPVEEAFSVVARAFRKPLRYCPPCVKQHNSQLAKALMMVGAPSIALCLLAGFTLERPGPRRNEVLVVPLSVLAYPLGLVLHELAHAFTAWAMRFRVFSILIGFHGPVLWRSEAAGTEIQVTCHPASGLTLVAPRSLDFYRLRMGAIWAAGPLMNASLAVAAYLLARPSLEMSLWASAFFWSNLFLVAISLFPWRYKTPRGVAASDGLALLTLPFVRRKSFEQRHAAYFALEGLASLKKKDYAAAIEWAQRGLCKYPGEIANCSIVGMGQLGLDQLDAARETFQSCLAESEKNLTHKAIFLMDLAWTEIGRDDRGDLEAANRASAEAFLLTPWVPAIRGTRGCALVDVGRLDEGIDLLKQALKDVEQSAKSDFASYLALAFAKQGLGDESRKYLEQARQFNPTCQILARTEKEISSAATCV